MAALQGAGAVQLDGGVDDVLGGLGGEELRHRGALRHVGGARVVRRRGRVDHEAGRLGAQGEIGHLVRDRLEVLQLAAERVAPGGVGERRVERGLRHADGEGADTRAEEVQGGHGDAEAAVRFAEHVVGGDRDRVEVEGADGVRGQHVQGGAGESGAVGGDQERGDSARSGVRGRTGEDGVEVGLGGVRDPGLLADEAPASGAVGLGAQCEGRGVGAGARLAEREGRDGGAVTDARQPVRALGVGAVRVHGVRAQPLEGERGLGLRAGAGEGLAHQAQVEGPGAEQPFQKAEPAELGDERPVHLPRFALLGKGREPLGGERA